MSEMLQNLKDRITRVLLWSETYTKTDMVYLASGGFWLVLGQAVSTLSAFILAVAFANLVPQETYGTYKYLISIAAMFSIFSLPGMGIAVARAAAQGKEHVIHSATRSRILFSIAGTVVALLGSGWYWLHHNNELSLALLIIAATLPIFDTTSTYLSYLAGKRRFDLQTKYHAATHVVGAAVLIVALSVTDNILIILMAYFVPLAIIRAVFYFATVRAIPSQEQDSANKETREYGLHLTAMSVLGTVATVVDKFLLWQFLGPIELAVYSFATALPEQLKGPLKGVGDLALPRFAQKTPEETKKMLPDMWRKVALYGGVLFLVSLLYIAVAPLIYSVLFPQYMESVIYSQIFSLSLVVGITTVPLAALAAQQKTKTQYVLNFIQPLTQIILFAVCIPLFGVMGAIGAWVASRFLSMFYVIVGTIRAFK